VCGALTTSQKQCSPVLQVDSEAAHLAPNEKLLIAKLIFLLSNPPKSQTKHAKKIQTSKAGLLAGLRLSVS